MKKQTGFTLIELLIGVVILGIMAAIAVPNFGTMVRNNQMKSAYNEFAGIIATARSEAINRGRTITACISTNQTTCVAGTGNDWSDGYMIFVDLNRNRTREATADPITNEEILSIVPPAPEGLTIRSNFNPALSIAARGRLASQGTFVFCDGDNEESARALNLWVTGLGRLATDDDDPPDGIVNGPDGVDITCP